MKKDTIKNLTKRKSHENITRLTKEHNNHKNEEFNKETKMIPKSGNIIEIKAVQKRYAPTKAYLDDSGFDLKANLSNEKYNIELKPGERININTGISIKLKKNWEAVIRPRSGLAIKHGITVLNSPGTIDRSYTGEIVVILINLGQNTVTIKDGDKIAQIIFQRIEQVALHISTPEENILYSKFEHEQKIERKSKGFGSTDKE